MIDLHTHILPKIDDGPQSVADALLLLQEEAQQGVSKIAFTPHFYPHKDNFDAFLEKRNASVLALQEQYNDTAPLDVRLGAEVHFSPKLMELDLRELTLGRSDYLLLELPFRHYPAHLNPFLEHLHFLGIVPLLAHVERCTYFREDSSLLYTLIEAGAVGQVNAKSLLDRKDKGFAHACLEHGLASVVASDCHNSDKRPPNLSAAMNVLQADLRTTVEQTTLSIWNNELPFPTPLSPVKRGLLGSFR